jgi:hypothetical protein
MDELNEYVSKIRSNPLPSANSIVIGRESHGSINAHDEEATI